VEQGRETCFEYKFYVLLTKLYKNVLDL